MGSTRPPDSFLNGTVLMSSLTSSSAATPLTNTLILALTQCQDQTRQLEKQSTLIDNLCHENERLKRELAEFRSKPNEDLEAKYKVQFQTVFKQVAEKQAEVDRLKEKLRSVKIKAQQRGLNTPISSSPAVPSSAVTSYLPRNPPIANPFKSVEETAKAVEAVATSPTLNSTSPALPHTNATRSSSPTRRPLEEVSANVDFAKPQPTKRADGKSKRWSRTEQVISAIPALTEDGEDHQPKRHKQEPETKTKAVPESVYHRLGDLLDTRGPASSVLPSTTTSPLKKRNTSPPHSAKPDPSSHDLPTPNSDTRFKRPRSSLAGSKRKSTLDPEDEEPFRCRPINRLGLKHFKVNPAVNSGLDFAYSEVIRGHERNCLPGCMKACCIGAFKALATTLPNLTGPNGQVLSDDELLLGYLGAGSEERIKGLTPKARENLLHDARTKLVADTYGKMHRDVHQRAKSPPGRWRTDMPGTQEEKNDRELAKLAEREEVIRRYDEAMRGGGRWMFADE